MTRDFPPISVCMIVRDEAELIAQAIGSVEAVAAEIIVSDTGSTDGTVDIARSLGAAVTCDSWDDDFALARNRTLDRARCEWIFVLDADEAVDRSQLDLLRELTLLPGRCALVTQRHYTDDARISGFVPCRGTHPQWEKTHVGYSESKLCRLFPNDSRIRYRGRVHELVEESVLEHRDLRLVESELVLHHYGRTIAVGRAEAKLIRYAKLAALKAGENPEDWQAQYDYGISCLLAGRAEEAKAAFQRATAQHAGYAPAWRNLGDAAARLDEFSDALDAYFHALELAPDDAENHGNIGALYARMGRFEFAEAHLRKAIELNPSLAPAAENLARLRALLAR